MKSTASDKVDQQDTSLKKGTSNENKFDEVQISQNKNSKKNQSNGNL